MSFEGEQLPEVEIDARDGVFDPDSGNGGGREVPSMKHSFDHGKEAFHQGSGSADRCVPQVLGSP